jgi:hypothetical protein
VWYGDDGSGRRNPSIRVETLVDNNNGKPPGFDFS